MMRTVHPSRGLRPSKMRPKRSWWRWTTINRVDGKLKGFRIGRWDLYWTYTHRREGRHLVAYHLHRSGRKLTRYEF